VNIYLAGKVEHTCWRHTIVKGLRESLHDVTSSCAVSEGDLSDDIEFPILRKAIFGQHNYTGPYFIGCDHGCWHGGGSEHGLSVELDHGTIAGVSRPVITSLCLEAIEDADLVFAWINSNDCYGTIAELGYAKGQGKLIAIAGPHKIHDMWFVYEMADVAIIPADDPKSALEAVIPQIITAKKFRDI
jgi:hypothetical protein